MRDPNRLFKFYGELYVVHSTKFPDWRFGQFICNFEKWIKNKKKIYDIFYIEEGEFLRFLKEFVEDMGCCDVKN